MDALAHLVSEFPVLITIIIFVLKTLQHVQQRHIKEMDVYKTVSAGKSPGIGEGNWKPIREQLANGVVIRIWKCMGECGS